MPRQHVTVKKTVREIAQKRSPLDFDVITVEYRHF